MEHRIKGEYLFLIYALIFGLLLVFLTPPLQAPDEQAHYANTYSMMKGDIWGEIINGEHVRKIPKAVNDFITKYSRFNLNYDEKMTYLEMRDVSWDSPADEYVYWKGPQALQISYLVSTTGMLLRSIITFIGGEERTSEMALPYGYMIFGRLANLLFFVFVIFYALKIIPCFKRTMLVFAMMPMTLFLGSSLNYDAILIPISFLFVAVVLKMNNERGKKINKKEIFIVLLCVFFLVGVKHVYATLLLMLLIIPKEKYGSKRNLIICIAAVIIVAIIAYTPDIINQRMSAFSDGSTEPIADEQGEWIKNNLFKLPGIFIHTIIEEKGAYLEQLWGRLGWLDTFFPRPLLTLGLLFTVVIALIETCSCTVFRCGEQWKRILPILAVIVSITGIFFILYWQETPRSYGFNQIGGDKVWGVQGRYFIPALLPLCVTFSNSVLSLVSRQKWMNAVRATRINTKIDCFVCIWTFICGLMTVLIVFLRYWI